MNFAKDKRSLLLILPLPVYRIGDEILIEPQAANGLSQWLNNFSKMTVGLKLLEGRAPIECVPISDLGFTDQLTVELFDPAWSPLTFLRHYSAQRKRLGALIDEHDFLQFAIGGFWGDWGAVGALEASKKGRKFSVWTDRVESEVMRLQSLQEFGPRRMVRALNAKMTKWLEKRVIRRSPLGLFHGKDTFDAYKAFSPNPQLVHDIHIKADERITAQELDTKVARSAAGPLDIIYVGRVHHDKGPLQWIKALKLVSDAGVDFRARWFGAGPMEREAQSLVQELGLASHIDFPGNQHDRVELLNKVRAAHIMAFCHLTPESPRCLIEALISGTPIVGYGSAYSADIISLNGGGRLTSMTPEALASEIILLDADRDLLRDLIVRAARDGTAFNDDHVFSHRSDLMKKFT